MGDLVDKAMELKQGGALKPLFGLAMPELAELAERLGEKPYRAKQIFEALYKQRVASLEEVTTLPVAFARADVRAGGRWGCRRWCRRRESSMGPSGI